MSKGSNQRPTDRQKFNTNWDNIFAKSKQGAGKRVAGRKKKAVR